MWFETDEAVISNWDDFRPELLDLYLSTDRKERAKTSLQGLN